MASFPVGSRVLLQGLVKGAHLNGRGGVVRSRPDAATGRQEVHVPDAGKSLAVRPANLRHVPRALSSLTASEMRAVLALRVREEGREPEEWPGVDEEALRGLVAAGIETEDPGEIAALVARANEPAEGGGGAPAPGGGVGAPRLGTEQLREGAERMARMGPDELRRQAATMRAMGPARLRACTPQMAGMTDAQINMAITQMESVANNPDQMRMAADQLKNMSHGDLRRAMDQSHAAAPSIGNVSKSQFQQATQQMASMSPDQLRRQAAMLKSMPLDTLRRSNPQMAGMTDAQIQMSISQLEQMADNPEMVKMCADQMKNMTEEQYESAKGMMGGGGLNNGGLAAGATGLPADPSKIMDALLSNPDQLNSAVKTMKQNPDMLKQMLASQLGAGGGGGSGSDAKQEQVEKAIDAFVEMDDEKLEQYLKMASKVQSAARPFVTAFEGAKRALGVSTRTLLILINLGILAGFALFVRRWKMGGGGGDVGTGDAVLVRVQEDLLPEIDRYESEF